MASTGRPLRPEWDTYFLGVANSVAARGDCTRRKVGCVIVDTDRRIIATGYNGSEPGGPSCLAGQCPRGQHYERWGWGYRGWCACGARWPCPDSVAPGSSYDSGAGSCIATHAEANALLFARASVKGATLYCTEEPCYGCAQLIKSSGITHVVIAPTPKED